MQTAYELKGSPLLQVKPIERRANCKMVKLSNNRKFLVGGMTAESITNQIYQFRLNNQYVPAKIQWKEVHFENNLFGPRNSYASCGSHTKIYIWGGLQMSTTQQVALADLIQLDIQKGRMRLLPLKQKIKIHSSLLFYDYLTNSLIGYGGSDQNSNMPAYLYKLNLQEKQQYQWIKHSINCPQHQGYIWQHSGNISSHSFFSQDKGTFLTVVGGCRFPHSPYKCIVEINLQNNQVTNSLNLEESLVSHDSVEKDGRLYIFGGSNGGDFNSLIYVLEKGVIAKLKGHRAIGCSCIMFQTNQILVYGGVCGSTSINGAFIYQ